MSAAAEAVLVYAVIHDLFDETDRVRALAIYGMVIALTPAIAPMRALDTTDSPTGVASAMLNTIPMLMGGLASICLSVFHDGTSPPLAFTVLGLLCISGFAHWMSPQQKMQSL
jgi:hypothetical protein